MNNLMTIRLSVSQHTKQNTVNYRLLKALMEWRKLFIFYCVFCDAISMYFFVHYITVVDWLNGTSMNRYLRLNRTECMTYYDTDHETRKWFWFLFMVIFLGKFFKSFYRGNFKIIFWKKFYLETILKGIFFYFFGKFLKDFL